jgi:hypothetical protein
MRITGLVARLVLEESAQFMRITGLVARKRSIYENHRFGCQAGP